MSELEKTTVDAVDELESFKEGISEATTLLNGMCAELKKMQSSISDTEANNDDQASEDTDSGKMFENTMVEMRNMYEKMKSRVVTETMELRENVVNQFSNVKKGVMDHVKKAQDSIKNMIPNKMKSSLKDVTGGLKGMIPDKLKSSFGSITNGIGGITGKLKGVGSRISGQFSGIMSAFGTDIAALGGPIGIIASLGMQAFNFLSAKIGEGLAQAMEMEGDEQGIVDSIKPKDGQSAEQAGKSFMDSLIDQASATHFSTEEMVNAGGSALELAGGDADMANEILKIAQDVSVNRGISLEEAMGKIKEEKDAGGNIKAAFAGDAGGMADYVMTTQEQLDSMKEVFENTFLNIGRAINEFIGPVLEPITRWFMENSETFNAFGEKLSEVFGTAGQYIAPFVGQFMEGLGGVIGKLGFLKDVFEAVWTSVSGIIQGVWSIVGPIIGLYWKYFALLGKIVWKLVGGAFNILYNIFMTVWDKLTPFFSWISEKLEWVGGLAKKMSEGVGAVLDWIDGFLFGDGSANDLEDMAQNVKDQMKVDDAVSEVQNKTTETLKEQTQVATDTAEDLYDHSMTDGGFADEREMTAFAADNSLVLGASTSIDNELLQGIKDALSAPKEIIVTVEKLANRIVAYDPNDVTKLIDEIETRLGETLAQKGGVVSAS